MTSAAGPTILGLNAFDAGAPRTHGALDGALAARARLFGAASVLFYDQPLEFVRGAGCWLYEADGTAYLDAYNNVPCVGHGHPHVVAAAAAQLAALNLHNRYLHPLILEYAAALLATFPEALSNVTFTCTGSESNDLALRLAARLTGASGVIVTATAYHGNTALTTHVSPSSFKRGGPPPHVRVVPAPDPRRAQPERLDAWFAAQVSAAANELIANGSGVSALLVDSIFSSDGVYADPPDLLRGAVDAVRRAGGVFIADEVQCGFGRLGTSLWGFERCGVVPDIVTLGKPMGNGYPMGAVVTRPDILQAFCTDVGYFNTFGGTPVAAAAGGAVLEVIAQEGLVDHAAQVGAHLRRGLAAVAARHPSIVEVRGAGLYVGVELAGAALARTVINGLRDRRVLIGAAGPRGDTLKIRPPLVFTRANADTLVTALDEALTAAPAA